MLRSLLTRRAMRWLFVRTSSTNCAYGVISLRISFLVLADLVRLNKHMFDSMRMYRRARSQCTRRMYRRAQSQCTRRICTDKTQDSRCVHHLKSQITDAKWMAIPEMVQGRIN